MTVGGDHLLALLGMRDVPAPAGTDLALEVPLRPQLCNPDGALQGGLLATAVDVAAGRAALATAGEGAHVPTTDMTLHFLAPVLVGPALVLARVRRAGRRLVVVQVEVHDAGRAEESPRGAGAPDAPGSPGPGVLAAVATLTFAVRRVVPRG